MRSFEWIWIRICDQDHTDHGALKELSFRRALGEFQKVRYYKYARGLLSSSLNGSSYCTGF